MPLGDSEEDANYAALIVPKKTHVPAPELGVDRSRKCSLSTFISSITQEQNIVNLLLLACGTKRENKSFYWQGLYTNTQNILRAVQELE